MIEEKKINLARELAIDINKALNESEFSGKFEDVEQALKKHKIAINKAKRMVSSNLAMVAFYY